MNLNQTQKKTNLIWQTLVLQNCWPLSQPAKFSSKKITQYLLGSRTSMNVFKYDQLRHLLLKLSPLIRTLFHSQLRLQNKIGRYIYYVPPTPPRDPNKLAEWTKRMKASNQLNRKFKRKQHYYKTMEKAKPIKVLFATINPIYSEIIESAANLCNMSFHTNRWLCGSLTANARYLKDRIQLESENHAQAPISDNISKVHLQFFKKFKSNKEVPEKRYNWHLLQKKSKRPTIVIIPDIHNNDMILRETQPLNIPVIGLINSSCATEVTYPIFGNANSIEIVHFFCHFLAVLIAKEVVQQDYKKKSHRIFARTRWVLQKDSIKIPRKFFRDRLTRISGHRPLQLQRLNSQNRNSKKPAKTRNHRKYSSTEKRSIKKNIHPKSIKTISRKLVQKPKKKRSFRSLRKDNIKQRIWKKSQLQLKKTKIRKKKLAIRKSQQSISKPKRKLLTDKNSKVDISQISKTSTMKKIQKIQRSKINKALALRQRNKSLFRLRFFFYSNLDRKKKRLYGRRQAQKRILRKNRKKVNNRAGARYFLQKDAHRLVFGRQYFPNFPRRHWTAGNWNTSAVLQRLLLIFQKTNFNRKRISKFFRKNVYLTYLVYSFLQQATKTRFRDSRRALFFEFYINQKRQKSISFSLPVWKQELMTTNESLWRNASGNYWRTRNKKKRIRAFGRKFFKGKKHRQKNRRFRGKIRPVRINKPYNWRLTKTLITKHQVQSLTRLWTRTQHHIYRKLQREFWREVAWYFDKKKRRKVWVKWRLHERIQRLDRRVKYPKRKKYKARFRKNQYQNPFQSINHDPTSKNKSHKSISKPKPQGNFKAPSDQKNLPLKDFNIRSHSSTPKIRISNQMNSKIEEKSIRNKSNAKNTRPMPQKPNQKNPSNFHGQSKRKT